jgi:D-glycero-alpha-D-manno-heptose-7-phosphate kinase
VISTALDMFVYITVNKRFDDKLRVIYYGNELVDSVDEIKHDIIRNALKIAGLEKGIEIIYSADIPLSNAGVGLASSSALTVGVMNALHAYKGEWVTPEQLAREACHIEIDCIGQRIGIQDQFAAAYGGFRNYRFFADGTVSADPVICDPKVLKQLAGNLLLFYTGSGRDSRKILNEQSETISQKMDRLDQLVEAVERNHRYLCEGKIEQWGLELDRAWQIKKTFAGGVSNPEIDAMYEAARHAGALGGKILGAGGGGFMLLYVPPERQSEVCQALCQYRKVDFRFEAEGSHIVFAD